MSNRNRRATVATKPPRCSSCGAPVDHPRIVDLVHAKTGQRREDVPMCQGCWTAPGAAWKLAWQAIEVDEADR